MNQGFTKGMATGDGFTDDDDIAEFFGAIADGSAEVPAPE